MNSNHKLSSGDLEELLPWHAAGTLDAHEAAEVERALAADPELARRFALVREELTETILLNESLGAPSARAMETLFRAIDQDREVVRRVATSPGLGARIAEFFSPRALAWTASAAAVIVMLQAGVIARMALEDRDGGAASGVASFETASAPVTRGLEIDSFAWCGSRRRPPWTTSTNFSMAAMPRSWTAPSRAASIACGWLAAACRGRNSPGS